MKKAIYFDMDGTLNCFYEVEGWLDDLQNEKVRPYIVAKPALNMSLLARLLNRLQARGWMLGVISCTSKCGSELYHGEIALAKLIWLHEHLKSVQWDEIKIVDYGTNKYEACGGGILFDDEERNRNTWEDEAYNPESIIPILKELLKGEK